MVMNTERYSSQLQLQHFGLVAQLQLLKSKVFVAGACRIEIPVLTYQKSMGVGSLGISDNDVVNIAYLQRQVAYREAAIGALKVDVLRNVLKAQNSRTKITIYPELWTTENALKRISLHDLVVDASDNCAIHYLVKHACIILNKLFIYGVFHASESQICIFNYQQELSYRRLFSKKLNPMVVAKGNENGVLEVIPEFIVNLQALAVVKIITAMGKVPFGKLLLFDGLKQPYKKIDFKKGALITKITKIANPYRFECSTSFSSSDSDRFHELGKTQSLPLLEVCSEKEFRENTLENAIRSPLPALGNQPIHLHLNQNLYVSCASRKRNRLALKKLQTDFPTANFINVKGRMHKLNIDVVKY